jgi:hypothetical protein
MSLAISSGVKALRRRLGSARSFALGTAFRPTPNGLLLNLPTSTSQLQKAIADSR